MWGCACGWIGACTVRMTWCACVGLYVYICACMCGWMCGWVHSLLCIYIMCLCWGYLCVYICACVGACGLYVSACVVV